MCPKREWGSGGQERLAVSVRGSEGTRPADSRALREEVSSAGWCTGLGWAGTGQGHVRKPIPEKPRSRTAERGDRDAGEESGDIQFLGLFTEVGCEHLE